jgi:hypothetical protein
VSLGFNAGLHSVRNRPDLTPIARSFPAEALPRFLRGAALYVSKSMRISTTITGMTANGVASLLAQSLARFKVPGGHGDTRPASIFSVIIAPSGSGKSTALNKFIRVVQAYDKASAPFHQKAMKQFELAHGDWKDDRKAMRNLIKKLRKDGNPWQHVQAELDELDKNEPIEPIDPRLLYSDITYRRFIDQLNGTGRSMGLVSDEAEIVFETLPRLCAHLNRGFDGSQITLDRANGESVIAYDAHITELLLVQNDIINRFDNSYVSKMRPIGYWGRHLFGTALKIVDERYLSDVNVCSDALDAYLERTSELMREIERRRREGITELDEVGLDDEATGCWEAFAEEMNSGMKCDDEVGPLVDISDFASRAAEHAGRLATVWTVVIGEKKISLETIQGAIEVIRFHLAEFQDRYSLLQAVPDLVLQAYDLDKYLQRIWKQGHRSVPKSFIERNAKDDFRDVANLDAALELLQMMSRVQLMPGRGRGLRIVHVPHPGRPFQFCK